MPSLQRSHVRLARANIEASIEASDEDTSVPHPHPPPPTDRLSATAQPTRGRA
jgi:hypothetical protein